MFPVLPPKGKWLARPGAHRSAGCNPALPAVGEAGALRFFLFQAEGTAHHVRIRSVNHHAAPGNELPEHFLRLGIRHGVIAFIRRDQQHVRLKPGTHIRKLHDFRIIPELPARPVHAQKITAPLGSAFHTERFQQRHGRGIQNGHPAPSALTEARNHFPGPGIAPAQGIQEIVPHPVQDPAVIQAAPAVGHDAGGSAHHDAADHLLRRQEPVQIIVEIAPVIDAAQERPSPVHGAHVRMLA